MPRRLQACLWMKHHLIHLHLLDRSLLGNIKYSPLNDLKNSCIEAKSVWWFDTCIFFWGKLFACDFFFVLLVFPFDEDIFFSGWN